VTHNNGEEFLTEDLDPVAVLSEAAEEVMRRLGYRFEVVVKGDYRKFPLTLTITVNEHDEEGEEDALPKD